MPLSPSIFTAAVVANRHDLEGRNPDAAHRLTGARAGAETYASIGRAVGMQRAAAVNTRGESFRFRAPLLAACATAPDLLQKCVRKRCVKGLPEAREHLNQRSFRAHLKLGNTTKD